MKGSEKFESDLFNAFAEVMFKYRDYPVNEPDHKAAVKDMMNKIIDRFYDGAEPKIEKLFEEAYEGSYYTIIGCGGDIEDWKDYYKKMLKENDIGTVKEWHEFSGKDMNDYYNLTGDNRYSDDLHFLMFPLDDLDIGKLAMFKLTMGDRWFDDIVENNRRRESR